MRIISGAFRGRPIEAPDGRSTRPTTDRVRESLFSTLYSKLGGFTGCCALDAFAGSGALGIEALSRGADHVTFCESDAKTSKVVQRNLERLGVDKTRWSLANRDIFQCAGRLSARPFDLVFLDPPYATLTSDVAQLVNDLSNAGLTLPGTLVCYEHDGKADLESLEIILGDEWRNSVNKKYGKTFISIFERN